ncbi:TraB/GumN family protein [Phenylobacterium sp.]|jgi:hypothetical protein|uniref:TraB/GumN family protein n=1 Tax=Phenylobacterium sp. TaxID=1871053 RepID=UPI002F3F77F0
MWKSLVLALAAALAAGAAQARPPVWTVRDRDSELVLFGSVHVLPPGLDWKPPALDRALKSADDVWFELPVDAASEAEVARLAAAQGVLPPGQTLSAMLGPPDAARLARVAQAFGASMPLIDRLEPWFAEVVLAVTLYARSGGTADAGVEKAVSAALPATAVRRSFETPAEQVALFDGAPMPEQIASLDETLGEMETDPHQYEQLLAAWMAGDVAALDREALAPLRKASPALFKRMLTDRNARWMGPLTARLAGKGRTVVVVGVGHLIGSGGLPARLRALGYSVEGP